MAEPARLTGPQLECIALLAEGLSLPDIATKVGTDLPGVNALIRSACTAVGAVDRTHLVAIAYRTSLLRSPHVQELHLQLQIEREALVLRTEELQLARADLDAERGARRAVETAAAKAESTEVWELRTQRDQALTLLKERDALVQQAYAAANDARSQLITTQGELQEARQALKANRRPAGGAKFEAGVDWAVGVITQQAQAMQLGMSRTGVGPGMCTAHRTQGVQAALDNLRTKRAAR